MNKKKIITALVIAFASSAVLAGNSTTEFQATSKINATCSMSAVNINIGVFLLPLSSQYFGGSINLLCSRETPYTIDVAYGGVYGQGQTGDGTYWEWSFLMDGRMYYAHRDQKGERIAIRNFSNLTTPAQYSELLGCTFSTQNDMYSRCNTGTPSSDYGMMKGATKGDSVAYSIFVPGDSSKVWNAGKNSYSGTGTGNQEKVTFQGKIIPAQSGSAYPAPDFYMDTVTAIIKY